MDGVFYDSKGNLLAIIDTTETVEERLVKKRDVIDIVRFYGSEKQKLKACEELCELQEALLKDVNKRCDIGIVEEIADVYIMLSQLEVIYDVDKDDLVDVIAYKLDRQLNRMRGSE